MLPYNESFGGLVLSGSKSDKDRKRRKEKAAKKKQSRRDNAERIHLKLGGRIENRQCILTLRVTHPADSQVYCEVDACVDTGATDSVIRHDVAEHLGLPQISVQRVATAGGTLDQPVVAAQLVILDKNGESGSVPVIPLISADEMPDQMLFGMDLLEGGVLTVDMVQHRWEWRLKRVRKK